MKHEVLCEQRQGAGCTVLTLCDGQLLYSVAMCWNIIQHYLLVYQANICYIALYLLLM